MFMSWIDQLFVVIIEFSALAFILLAAGFCALHWFNQPLERIRLIQVCLASVLLATLIGHSSWLPTTELAWLPIETNFERSHEQVISPTAATPETDTATASTTATLETPSQSQSELSNETTFVPLNDDLRESTASKPLFASTAWRFLQALVVIGFIAISSWQAIYLLFGYLITHRLVSNATPIDAANCPDITQFQRTRCGDRIRLSTSEQISVPIATGIRRPTIILPKNLVDHASAARIRHCLEHEWKHIEGNDLATWQLASCLQILLWPQPFYWVLKRELRLSQDQIADQFATSEDDEHIAYATTLVEFSKARHSSMLGALTMADSKSSLYRRIEMLLNSDFHVAGVSRKRFVLAFAGLMTAASLLLASLQLTQAEEGTKPAGDEQKAEATTEAEPVEHDGFVVDIDSEQPVSNATVIVTRMRSDTWEEIAVTESQTDETGRFTFTIPPDQLSQRYLYIMFDLRHETYAPRHCGSYSYAMIRKNLSLGADPWFKKLPMVPGSNISGRLIDAAGTPVVGAEIRVRSRVSTPDQLAGQSYSDLTTDGDGRFESIVTAEGDASVSVIPINHCMKHVELGSKRGDLGDISLEQGVSISGQVVDAVGKPLEGLWVNLTEIETRNEASYEAKRSSKTSAAGEFRTRPLKPGKYELTVETKATGALEKQKWANFHDTPPPAVFVKQTIDVRGTDKPFVIQAVPHVYIKGQCYNPEGEITRCHFPTVMGELDKQFMWIRSKKGKQVGEFELLVPHGMQKARLRFSTNEHTGLMIQMPGKEPSPQRTFQYESLDDDLLGIKVVRYVAPIVQVKVIDEDGELVTDCRVSAQYAGNAEGKGNMMMEQQLAGYFEKQTNGLHRSGSLVPGVEFEVFARKSGFTSERKRMTMKEGTNETIRIKLSPGEEDKSESLIERATGFLQRK